MTKLAARLAPLALLLAAQAALGRYFLGDIAKIPASRIIENLERQAREEPGKMQPIYALARVHSIVYAMKVEAIDAARKDLAPIFGEGVEQLLPPWGFLSINTPEVVKDSTEHLAKAIELYRKALGLNPDHIGSLLGLGWCLDQSGDGQGALDAYRAAYKAALEIELEEPDLCEPSMAREAAIYLLRKLDRDRDESEIQAIEKSIERLRGRPRWVTPLLVPLEPGARLEELVDPGAGVAFDLDGSGARDRWGWITPRAAWLVFDPAGEGRIGSALQMFGSVSFWVFWPDGFEALRALDDDGDGELRGAELRGLALWRDANGDGVAQPGEVRPLAEFGIEALSCRARRRADGILWSERGAALRGGGALPLYDWTPRRIGPGGE